jgi:hypothetical protein
MGYNPFCKYYRHRGIPQPRKSSTGLQSFFSSDKYQETIRVHECYHPENVDVSGKLHSASWTCDQKFDCSFKRVPSKG